MRKVLRKVKSQWVVLGVMGATVVSLGTANIQKVSAAETEGAGIIETSEQTGSTVAPTEPITILEEETITEEVVDSNLDEGETTRPTGEISAVETKDVTAPVIDGSSISVVKTSVTQGESIHVSVNITDDSGIALASITYVSPITGRSETIALSKNEISGLFEGAFTVTDATELGVWECNKIEASDTQGNSSSLSGSDADFSGADFTANKTTATADTKSVMQAASVEVLQASAASPEVTGLSAAGIATMEVQESPVVNLAAEGTISTSVPFDNIAYATNAQTGNTAEYARGTSGVQWVQMDLGASYDLKEIQLWHYYGDGRSYRDVIVQLSNDVTFANGAVTVFNNDTNGSAGLGVGTDSEYIETSAGKTIAFDAMNARYARFYSNGSTVNGANHYVEIEVYGVEPQTVPTMNLVPESTLTSSVTFDNLPYASNTKADNTAEYARGTSGLQWVQADLGASYDINEINLWHYYGDGRSYHDVVVQLSNDATFSSGAVTVFNNDRNGSAGLGVGTDSEYSETNAGKTISFDTVTARYARFYSNGSTVNGANHYVEIEVYGVEPQTVPTMNLVPESTLTSSVTFDNLPYASNTKADNTAEYARGTSGLQWVQADLGASYDLNEIQLWHYYGDGRSYHDVVVQLSNDATFSSGAVTVFNNDRNGSAGLGVGTDSEYSETNAGKTISFDTVTARYARFYSNGSTVNGANHYVEIEVYGVEPQTVPTVNLVPEGTLSSSVPFDNTSSATDKLADDTAKYARGTSGLQWMQVDLGASYDLNEIQLWHYYGDGRSYHDVVVQLSDDATFSKDIVTVFNNDKDSSASLGVGTDSEYKETSAGKTIVFDTVTARYVRFYSNGSTVNGANHYVEIEVYGVEPQIVPTVNLAPEGTLSSSVPFDNSAFATDKLTDDTADYARGTNGLQWVQVDLGAAYDLNEIQLWHYYGDSRSYRDVVVQLSNDANFLSGAVTVFNNDTDNSAGLGVGTDSEYSETSAGKTIAFDAVNARYARFYSNGSNVNAWNHYVEIEVYGNALTKTESKTETVTENVVSYTTIERLDNALPTGQTELIQAGVDGYETVTYEVTYTNGVETGREETGRATTAPVEKIIVIGTKVAPLDDTNPPQISSILFDKDTVQAGDKITITATVTGYVAESSHINADIYSPEQFQGSTNLYKVTDDIYEGTFDVTDAAPAGNWRILFARVVNGGGGSEAVIINQNTTFVVENMDADLTVYDELINAVLEERYTPESWAIYQTVVDSNVVSVKNTQTEVQQAIAAIRDAQSNLFSVVVVTVATETGTLIVENGKSLQLYASISSGSTHDATLTWIVENGTGTATIDTAGLLTATSAGTVTVKATANDGSSVFGTKEITIAKPVSITGYEGIANGELVIPGVIDGSKLVNGYYGDFFIGNILGVDELGIVTSIGENAFRAKQLTSVIIPDSVTAIGPGAFGDNQLTSAYIPEGVTTLGAGAFYINKLSEIIIPKGISIIERYTFGNNELTSVDIPNNVTIIHDAAFGNNKLNHVTLSEGLEIIRTGAFGSGGGTNQLTILDIPDSVTEIGSLAFENNKLSVISIGSGVKIWDNALGWWNNSFRDAYEANGANVYIGSQNGTWEVGDPAILDLDTDGDSFMDYEEWFIYGTDSNRPNTIVLSKEDSSLLFDYDYLSEAFYKGSLNRSDLSEAALWFGNNVLSDEGSKQMIYESVLYDFMKDLYQKSDTAVFYEDVLTATQNYLKESNDNIEKIALFGATSSDAEVAIENIERLINELDALITEANNNGNSDVLSMTLLEKSEILKSAWDIFSDQKEFFDGHIELINQFTKLISEKGQLPKQFSDVVKSYGNNLMDNVMKGVSSVKELDTLFDVAEIAWDSFNTISGDNLLMNSEIDHKAILETISSKTEDIALKNAADSILDVLEAEISAERNAVLSLIDQTKASGLKWGVNTLIKAIPGVGSMISFSVDLADMIVNLSGITVNTTKLTGIATAAHILTEDLAEKLTGLKTNKGYYADYSGDVVKEAELNLLTYQLAQVRVTAEKQFGEAIEAFPDFLLNASGVSDEAMAYVQDLKGDWGEQFNVFDNYLKNFQDKTQNESTC